MRFYLLILSLVLSIITCKAQIGLTFDEIDKTNHANGAVSMGSMLLGDEATYTFKQHSAASGNYSKDINYYFDKDGICDSFVTIEPRTELDTYIKDFNSKYVKNGGTKLERRKIALTQENSN